MLLALTLLLHSILPSPEQAKVYPNATHSFALFQDIGGNPTAVEDGWTRTMAFLRAHTRSRSQTASQPGREDIR
jgi:dienelactone hydrolase